MFDWYAPSAVFRAGASQPWSDQLKPGTLWPLQVGKVVSGTYKGAGADPNFQGIWKHTLTVEKYEKVTVKAGTFDTFVVTFDQEGVTHSLRSKLRQWYAPEPGVTIKYEFYEERGPSESSEAVSIGK
jgi:hypothetical protein